MLGKLIKYEFRATGRILLPLFGALILAACISRLFSSLRFETPSAIGIAISVILIIATFVIVLVLTLMRFSRNLLSNEGYLMFTLPVTTDSLIWSKLIVAFVWNILSLVAVFLAITIMSVTRFNCSEAWAKMLSELAKIGITEAHVTGFIVEFIAIFIVGLLATIIFMYACLAASQLVNKHRGLFSFGVFIGLNIIGQIVSSVAASIFVTKPIHYYENLDISQIVGMANTGAVFIIAFSLVSGAVLYIFTRYMLKRRLNLE
jgi:hypothetical protein